jgi:uroporphyrinogen-III decarboxylase
MKRETYLGLAAGGLRMPIGTDLVLQELTDPAEVVRSGERLGEVVVRAARRWRTPLALAHMDLEVEKEWVLTAMGVGLEAIPTFHLEDAMGEGMCEGLARRLAGHGTPRMTAQIECLERVAKEVDLVPVAMCIGPFSLMTKLLADPISAVGMAGMGIGAAEDAEVQRMESALELALMTVRASVRAKMEAGARAVCVAEPAANAVYLSPRQIARGSDIFERYVMRPLVELRGLLAEGGVDLMFHCCGELTEGMVRRFGELDPAIMSLGSSRRLWEDARLVSSQTVLWGNLPSKRFYADELPVKAVVERAAELAGRMREAGHPFIMSSECDVLSVGGREQVIREKVEAFMSAGFG